jgi:hypothetical protein
MVDLGEPNMAMHGSGAATMAKPKKTAPKSKGQPWGKSQPLAAQLRGSPEWKEWLEAFASANRLSVAGVIDMALARLARELGFREPPER